MINMPPMGLGTFRLKGEPLLATLTNGLELGYRHIDTAQIYDNEAEVGAVLTRSTVARHEIYLTTKVWDQRVWPGQGAPEPGGKPGKTGH